MSLKYFFAAFLIVFLSLPAFNLAVDRYRVFDALDGKLDFVYVKGDQEINRKPGSKAEMRDRFKYGFNDRFASLAFALNQPEGKVNILLGNSKMHVYDPKLMGANWVRVSYNGGTLDEHIKQIKALVRGRCKKDCGNQIGKIIVGLDQDQFIKKTKPDDNHPIPLNKIPYPETVADWLMIARRYLFEAPSKKSFFMAVGHRHKLKKADSLNDGGMALYQRELSDGRAIFMSGKKVDVSLSRARESGEKLKKIKNWLGEKGVELDYFFQPASSSIVSRYDPKDLSKAKKLIGCDEGCHDFFTLNEFSSDESLWFEEVHFSGALAGQVISGIKQDKN